MHRSHSKHTYPCDKFFPKETSHCYINEDGIYWKASDNSPIDKDGVTSIVRKTMKQVQKKKSRQYNKQVIKDGIE